MVGEWEEFARFSVFREEELLMLCRDYCAMTLYAKVTLHQKTTVDQMQRAEENRSIEERRRQYRGVPPFLHPGTLRNMEPEITKLWNTIFLYNPVVFNFHVNLPGRN